MVENWANDSLIRKPQSAFVGFYLRQYRFTKEIVAFKGGESFSQLRWFIIAKIELQFLIFFVLILRLRLQRYSKNAKRYPPKKVFGNSEFCSSRQNHSRPNSLENCGFGGKNKTQIFQTLFLGLSFCICRISLQPQPQNYNKNYQKFIVQFYLL